MWRNYLKTLHTNDTLVPPTVQTMGADIPRRSLDVHSGSLVHDHQTSDSNDKSPYADPDHDGFDAAT
jgi:hypothetical protein